MAPITASPAEIRMPAKIAGIAPGNCSLVSTVQRLAPWSWNSSRWLLSADCSPNSVLETIGNSAISTQTRTRAERL